MYGCLTGWSEPVAMTAADITGLVLAGGRGSRMGGVDKGLQDHLGLPLALHALKRLQTQVTTVMISANRNLAAYESMGVPVWPDPVGDFPGPLGGLLAGLERCNTPYLVTVPCDTPNFPLDLVARLATAMASAQASVAMAATLEEGQMRSQPVFALLRADLLPSLANYLHRGERMMAPWLHAQGSVDVLFDDAGAFFNVNTAAELQQLQTRLA